MTKFKAVNMKAESSHDHQPMAIFQSVLLPPPPTLPAPCFPFFPLFFSMQRRRRTERDQTTHTDPGLHHPPPASSSPAICARPSACNSTTTRPWTSAEESIHHWRKREKDRERKWKERKDGWRWRGVEGVAGKRRGEEKRKWDAMKLNHRKGRVGQRRGTD